MLKLKKLYAMVAVMLLATLLVACGDNTATTAPATTAAATTAAATTAAATTAAATTAAATTAAATTAAATTAAATTAAATTAAATTAAATTAAATTAATGGAVDANGIEPFAKYGELPAGAKKGGNLNWVSLGKQLAPTLHPYPQAVDYTSSIIDVNSYLWGTTLLDYDSQTLLWRYGGAQKLDISSDGKTYTFTLRDGLKFSDGSAITGDDYAYAFQQASKEDPNPDNNYVGIDDIKNVASFTASGNTITCTLKDVVAKNLALSYCGAVIPLKKSVWSQYPFYDNQKNPEILKPTVTSGPYTLKTFKLDEQIVLQVNPNYYKGVGNFETITYLPSAQPTNVYDSIKAGQNQFGPNISPAQYNDAKNNSQVKLVQWNAGNSTYRDIEFNSTRAPFNDKAMRVAVAYSIDRAALLKATDNGLGQLANSFVNPNDKNFYNPNVTKYDYSLDKAKQTLQAAGYTLDGDTLKDKTGKAVEFTVVFPTTSNPRKLQAQYLQQQLKQLGMKVNVDGQEFNAYVKKVNDLDYDISLAAYGGGTPIDPNSAKGQFKSKDNGGTQNKYGYSNPKIDQLFDQGIKETDNAKRKEIYNQIQQILTDDLPVYFLYSLDSFSVTSANMVGVKGGLTSNLYDDEVISRWAFSG